MNSTHITPEARAEFFGRKGNDRFKYLSLVVGVSLDGATQDEKNAVAARLNGNDAVVCNLVDDEKELVDETYKWHEQGWCTITIIGIDADHSAVFMWRD